MGTYLHVKARGLRYRVEMLHFLGVHFRDAPDLFDWVEEKDSIGPPQLGKEVCAYGRANDIGYYYRLSLGHEARDYVVSIMQWLAIKIGKPKTFPANHIPGIPDEVHLPVVHWEIDPVPLVIRRQFPEVPDGWPNEKYVTCDCCGWDPLYRPLPEGIMPGGNLADIRDRKERASPLIREELRRLDFLWRSRPLIQVPAEVRKKVCDPFTNGLPLVLAFRKGKPSKVLSWEHIRRAGPAYGAPPDERSYTYWRRCHTKSYWAWYVPPRFMPEVSA